ncbi:MAG: CZB domain-containing protein [Thiotrichaceae bacterium]|nr:CZB domain-containing protein [Thiotrichaceae bacterium]
MAKKAFFMMRLNDHIQYLKKMDSRLKGEGDFNGTTHKECKLGQWISSPEAIEEIAALEDSKGKEVFDSLIEPHEHFHRISHDALEKKLAGDEAAAQLLFTDLHKFSATLTNKLLELDGMK